MGWCSGTEIFDAVLDAALPYVPESEHEAFAAKIAEPLWDGDWDCENDSKYWELLEPIMQRKFPHLDWSDE